ncbi:MAG: tetratricopeptide repeat protein [Nitrospirae bacterium]|nr:tetratricopeptide repeat protein [Nitrospirota bacterium]
MPMSPDPPHSDAFLRGMIFLHRGNLDGARRCFEDVLPEERQRDDPQRLIPVLMNLGSVYAALGNHQRARASYEEVLALQRGAFDARTVGQTLVNLGNLSRELGEPDRARAYYLEARDLLEPVGDQRSLGILLSNFAMLDADARRLDDAIALLKQAIDLHKHTGYEEGLAGTWGKLGQVFLHAGQLREAETCFNYSAGHFISLGDAAGEAEALRGLADVYEARPDAELARRCATRVSEIQRRYGLPNEERDVARAVRLGIAHPAWGHAEATPSAQADQTERHD